MILRLSAYLTAALLLSRAVPGNCWHTWQTRHLTGPALSEAPAVNCSSYNTKCLCGSPSALPRAERCSFISSCCESESRIPYRKWYYCGAQAHGAPGKLLFMVLALLLLPLLFCALGDTAEMYFSPIMALISQCIPKVRPRFAGVTFVALGNGAPDLSSNISAIKSGVDKDIILSAGALTGAAMFVQCIVGSEVLRLADGVHFRGAMLRDVVVYLMAIMLVLMFFVMGVINYLFVTLAILIYTLLVVWVFVGDEWHQQGRPSTRVILAHFRAKLRCLFGGKYQGSVMVDAYEEALLPWAEVDAGGADAHRHQPRALTMQPLTSLSSPTPGTLAGTNSPVAPSSPTFIDTRRYQHMAMAEAADSEFGSFDDEVPSWDDPELMDQAGPYHPPSPDRPAQALELPPLAVSPAPPSTRAHTYTQLQLPHTEPTLSSTPSSPRPQRPTTLYLRVRYELTLGQSEEWEELTGVRRAFRQASFPLLLPLYTALRITIPFIDPRLYDGRWLVTTLMFAPFAVVAYLGGWGFWWLFGATLGASVLAVMLMPALMRNYRELPPVKVGKTSIGPQLFSLMGFFMGVLWIDTLASEVVGLLNLFGDLLSIPSGVLGLTLLAWGNSLGDFFGNRAMASQGHANMALTACFAGPLFNMLIALSLGFALFFAKEGISSQRVRLTPEVTLGCVFLVVYNTTIIFVGMANRRRLPKQFYLFAQFWYLLYFVLACVLGTLYRPSQSCAPH